MKSIIAIICFATAARATVEGFDISHYQTNVNFPAAKAAGAGFVIIKACVTLAGARSICNSASLTNH